MLIVEEMYLLLTADEDGSDRSQGHRRRGVNAAVLMDMAEAGVITLSEDEDPKVTVVKAGMTAQPVLDAVLPGLDQVSGKPLSAVLSNGKIDPTTAVTEALAERGVLKEQEKSFTTADSSAERSLHARLGAVLSGERQPGDADALHLGTLKAFNIAYAVLADVRGERDRDALAERIEDLTGEVPAVRVVQRLMDSLGSTVSASAVGAAGIDS